MKDLFENNLISLIFGLLNGWDITFEGYVMPTGINETISNSFWMYLFNFDFLMFSERFNPSLQYNLNITTNLIN